MSSHGRHGLAMGLCRSASGISCHHHKSYRTATSQSNQYNHHHLRKDEQRTVRLNANKQSEAKRATTCGRFITNLPLPPYPRFYVNEPRRQSVNYNLEQTLAIKQANQNSNESHEACVKRILRRDFGGFLLIGCE